ncbi:MAG: F0F1 ATP synthase subunit I [Rhodospirillaceae bacterium]|nr:F0F1 ATP synthase subunit I [Rhodospirillaceae bacterium]|tara:strand:+ start:1160 stop:1510 length:351 start_codon:yes stop_codon:yes gene_type:complete
MTDQPPDLSDLQQRIAAAREREEAATRPDPQKRATASGYGMAMRLAMEMVAALGVSVFLGIWLDGELGTAPLFIMIFLVMGMGAGFINVYKTVSGFTHGSLRGPASDKKDGTTRGD